MKSKVSTIHVMTAHWHALKIRSNYWVHHACSNVPGIASSIPLNCSSHQFINTRCTFTSPTNLSYLITVYVQVDLFASSDIHLYDSPMEVVGHQNRSKPRNNFINGVSVNMIIEMKRILFIDKSKHSEIHVSWRFLNTFLFHPFICLKSNNNNNAYILVRYLAL